MKKLAILIAILVVVAAFFATVAKFSGRSDLPPAGESSIPLTHGPPVFEWIYDSSEEDGIPRTRISLAVHYADLTGETKLIDTVEGGCDEIEQKPLDAYVDSSMILCYYAGLGHYYKVVKSGEEFLVQRKTFEEATPDYNPPVQEFETVERF